jgi:hypothetical protein
MSMHRPTDLHEVGGDIAEVLAEVLSWQLNTERWQQIAALLDSVEDALRRRDPDDLYADTADLQRLGPVRIVRIGSSPSPSPAPRDVRERLVRLVHELEGVLATGRPLPANERPAPETRG